MTCSYSLSIVYIVDLVLTGHVSQQGEPGKDGMSGIPGVDGAKVNLFPLHIHFIK